MRAKTPKSFWGKLARTAGFAALGFAAIAIPLHLFLRRELAGAPDVIRAQGWPIRLMQVLFTKYILRWIEVEGVEHLPNGSFVLAANHAYKSGVDGFILGHLLATRVGCVPRIVITADSRNWMVRAERWVLHHYGIALLVADPLLGKRQGVSDTIAAYLREGERHAVLIFPAGRAIADPLRQLQNWSTGAMVAAMKAGTPVVPAAIGGLRLDWSPETVILAAMDADEASAETNPPFRMRVRLGASLWPTGHPMHDTERLRETVAGLMADIPGFRPTPGESAPGFGKITLRDGRTLAFMDRGPRAGTPVLYFHGFQGSRIECMAANDALLERLRIRLITPDRPGMGLSTPSRHRTVTDWASDVRELTGQLLGEGAPFSILGFSAGATYALSCGQLRGLQAVSLVGSLGLPHLISNWRRFSQETWHILLSAKLASFRPATFLRIEAKHRDRLFSHWESYFEDVKRGLSPSDQRTLSRPEVEEAFQQNRRESYAQGSGSMLQEVQALYSDLHLDLNQLTACTVLITHGLADQVVPVGVARHLQTLIPGSGYQELPRQGHYFLYDEVEMENLLRALLRAQCQP
ncbi:MAG: alpha/beta fold hydrolase [Acidobacteria bacterium]|nr:alpha/beta fold hydrolase [Acidobacteriota bacterium]